VRNVILTALAPIFWGTTYLIATELLPERPFFVAIMRALPVGVAMILIYRKLPRGKWWWRMFVLGGLNIGLFFALLFVAAYRIPGGVVATIGAIQPLIVLLIAWLLLGNQLLPLAIAAAGGGILGVGMLVFSPTAQFDMIGILAAVGAALVMAGGTVLTKHWGRPVPLLLFTAWQLTAGGIILIPLAVVFEQPLPTATATNLIGYAWLVWSTLRLLMYSGFAASNG
jgi:probable blue pigment (indigoidine) exporter